ncbi:MAG: tetratricopeptide repeat protein [Paludibacteraceae bacterium]|nr:tetratricopeptide repeat protein [Paludibacteraceae bacterium]
MTNRDFEILYKNVCVETCNKELNAAFNHLKELITETNNSFWEEQRGELENTYLNMLKYATDAIQDPNQESIYKSIQIQLLELADTVRNQFFTKNSNNIVYQHKRTSPLLHFSWPETFNIQEHHTQLFHVLWLTEKYDKEFSNHIKDLLADPSIDEGCKCTYIAAIMLGLIRTFDEEKFHLLLDKIDDPIKSIKQRALIGIIFCTNIHSARINIYSKLSSRMQYMFDNEDIAENLQKTIIQILLSKETDKITKKMNDTLPDLIKNSSLKELKKNKINIEDLINEGNEMSIINPKWDSIMENSGVSDKMMELSNLQMEGGDIFMSTFASLKNFAFFNTIENWFLPFFHQTIAKKYELNDSDFAQQLTGLLNESVFLCNSDKYSMIYSINEMPNQYKEMIKNTFQMEKDQLGELKNANLPTAYSEESNIARMYIQDLFRFYNLYFFKKDFSNPFLSIKNFNDNILIQNNPKSKEIKLAIIDFFIKKEYYQQAIQLLTTLSEKQPTQIDYLQKIAFCYQQQGDYDNAITYYQKAETLQSGTLWNLKRLAYCLKCNKKYEDSLFYYQQCETLSPDDLNIQSNIGYCLINLQRYQEALKIFFKIEYLAPENNNAAKAIGWCSFVCNKLEQAEKYYLKSAEDKRNETDWMNIGHIQLCLNKKDEAIQYYKKAYLKIDSDPKKFSQLFNEDKIYLTQNGIEEKNIPLYKDYILYKISRTEA